MHKITDIYSFFKNFYELQLKVVIKYHLLSCLKLDLYYDLLEFAQSVTISLVCDCQNCLNKRQAIFSFEFFVCSYLFSDHDQLVTENSQTVTVCVFLLKVEELIIYFEFHFIDASLMTKATVE